MKIAEPEVTYKIGTEINVSVARVGDDTTFKTILEGVDYENRIVYYKGSIPKLMVDSHIFNKQGEFVLRMEMVEYKGEKMIADRGIGAFHIGHGLNADDFEMEDIFIK